MPILKVAQPAVVAGLGIYSLSTTPREKIPIPPTYATGATASPRTSPVPGKPHWFRPRPPRPKRLARYVDKSTVGADGTQMISQSVKPASGFIFRAGHLSETYIHAASN